MNIIQCRICKKAFHSVGGKICPECLEQIEKDYITIRDYLYDHPDQTNAEALAEATGVARSVVIHLIEKGRLFAKTASADVNKCQICGKPLSYGVICDSCNGLLTAGIKNKEAPPKDLFVSKKGDLGKGDSISKMHVGRKN